MTRLLLISTLFISAFAFADPTISIKSNSIVDAGRTQNITREKVINVSKAQRDINSKIAEEVKAERISKNRVTGYSSGIEYSLGSVVLPYIKAIENGELDDMGTESIGYIRRCALNSHRPPTVIGSMFGYGGEILQSQRGGLGGQGGAIQTQEAIQNMTTSMPSFMTVSKKIERDQRYIASKYGIRSEAPQEAVLCYFYYGVLYEQIARSVFEQSILVEESRENTTLYIDSLQISVAKAVAKAVKDDALLNRAKQLANQSAGNICTVPSLQALNRGQLDFSCGSFSFNYQTQEALDGNSIIWSKTTFMGGSITLAEVNAFEIAKANEIASVYRKTAEEIQANERGTGLNKSTSLVQVRDTKVSTGGDTSVSN